MIWWELIAFIDYNKSDPSITYVSRKGRIFVGSTIYEEKVYY